MARIRNLRNAPVTEAVVQISARFSAAPDASAFQAFCDALKHDYPRQETRQEVGFKFTPKNQEISALQNKFAGNLVRSGDGRRVAQSLPEGFAFSLLKPYTHWDDMLTEAWRLWAVYRATFKPERVVRIATRFINRLELPDTKLDFDDYFTISPRLPDGIPSQLSAFSTALQIPGVAEHTLAAVRVAFDGASVKDTVPVILDLDIIRELDVDPNDDQVRVEIEELRPIKNAVFFGSLTEKAVEVFE